MRRGRIFIYLALILLLALGGGYWFLNQNVDGGASGVPTPSLVEVVVAGQNISQGSTITEETLATVLLPQDKVVAVMFTVDQKDQLINKVAKYPLEQGVMITRPMVGNPGEIASTGPDWVSLISPGMTAMAVPTTRLSSVAYGVADGAHVNVIACFLFIDVDPTYQSILPNYSSIVTGSGFVEGAPPVLTASAIGGGEGSSLGRIELDPTLQQPFYVIPSEEQRARPVCQMVFQDAIVMRLGNFPVRETSLEENADAITQDAGAPQPAVAPEDVRPDIITLMVSPQDAVTLTYLIYGGAHLTLTLRGAGDTARVETEAATLQFVLSQYAIPVPAKLPYAVASRISELVEPNLQNDTVAPPEQ